MTTYQARLAQRVVERNTLLTQLTNVLRDDTRVAAAWLSGSLGRDEGDVWSDLDVWVVIEDDALPPIRADFQALLQPLELLLTFEQIYNGSLGGTQFNCILHGGDTGAQNLDMNLMPRSAACSPPQTRSLFDKIGLYKCAEPFATGVNPSKIYTDSQQAFRSARFFCMMVPIIAKYVARNPNEEQMSLLTYAYTALNEVCYYVGESDLPLLETLPATPTPAEKIAVLQNLLDTATSTFSSLRADNETERCFVVLYPRLVVSIKSFLEIVEASTVPSDERL